MSFLGKISCDQPLFAIFPIPSFAQNKLLIGQVIGYCTEISLFHMPKRSLQSIRLRRKSVVFGIYRMLSGRFKNLFLTPVLEYLFACVFCRLQNSFEASDHTKLVLPE